MPATKIRLTWRFPSLKVAVLALAIAYSCAAAETPTTGSLTLADALALTLKQSPELSAYSWDVRAAEARIIQARLRPNPELSVQAENLFGTREYKNASSAEYTLQLSQLVELGGKRSARVEEARLGRALSEFDYQVQRVDVLRATTEAFIDVLAAQRRVALAEETVKLWQGAVPLTKKRVDAGAASPTELTRGNVAVALAEVGLAQAKRDLLGAKGVLAAQWGETKAARFERVVGDLDRMEAPPPFKTLVVQLTRNPHIARWTAERERRQAALRLQKAQRVPDVTIGAGPRMLGKGDDYTLGTIGFSLPLPFFNRNQGNIAEAEALLSKTDPEERAAESKAFGELSVAYQTLLRANEEVDILKGKVLPGATQTVEQLAEGYEAGKFSQLEILEARRTLTDARLQHLRALADYHKALAQVEALTAAPVELHGHLGTRKVTNPAPATPNKPLRK